MTPERLATLCGLLPEFRFTEDVAPTNDAIYVQFDGEWHDVSGTSHVADHLHMEALRAVEKRGIHVQVDFGKPAHVRLFRRWDLPPIATGDDGDPLHALLDAVREAGLVELKEPQ